MEEITRNDWREMFRDVVARWEQPDKVERLDEACNAIYGRLRGPCASNSLHNEERGEMHDALYFLRLLSTAAEVEARVRRPYLMKRGA